LKRLALGIAALATAFFASAAFAAPVVDNGSFETGNFHGWTTKGGSKVHWQVYSAADPIAAPHPPQGTYAATVDEDGASTPVLLQHFTVPKHAELKLFSGYDNLATDFATPHTLKVSGGPNQQYRIDIMRAGAPIKSLDGKDVLMNVFRTKVGDPATAEPEKLTADLSKLAGEKVYLRFAVPNNQLPLHIFVDGVKVAH
jgi:hypothetical protein